MNQPRATDTHAYRAPRRAWRWGLTVMLAQAPVLLLTSGSSMNLLPLGLVLFAVLALPAIAVAMVAAFPDPQQPASGKAGAIHSASSRRRALASAKLIVDSDMRFAPEDG